MVAYIYIPSTWEASSGGLQVQDHPELYSKFHAFLDYVVKPCLKNSHVCHQLVLLANFYTFFTLYILKVGCGTSSSLVSGKVSSEERSDPA